jgi:transcription elongation factor GreA
MKKAIKKEEKKEEIIIPNIKQEKMTLITKEGLKKLVDELKYLKEVKRREIAQRIKEAISYGDLSENSEYEEAKNDQAFVEGRILELEQKVKNAEIIKEKKANVPTVQLGSKVRLINLSSKSPKEEDYFIVGSTEADVLVNKISNESPVGREILDKQAGDTVKIKVPAGEHVYKIVKCE